MFMIVSPDDCQVYEMKLKKYKKEINYIQELVAYASLDLVDNQEWNSGNTNMNLKKIAIRLSFWPGKKKKFDALCS